MFNKDFFKPRDSKNLFIYKFFKVKKVLLSKCLCKTYNAIQGNAYIMAPQQLDFVSNGR